MPYQGRFVHEAVTELDGILYQTEDRNLQADLVVGTIGAVFYRFVPDGWQGDDDDDDGRGRSRSRGDDNNGQGRSRGGSDDGDGGRSRHGFDGKDRLQGLKLKNEERANMDVGRIVGKPYPVEWVDIDEPDHEDDTDNERTRTPGRTPTRIQAIDKGAAFFDRQEGIWTEVANIDDGDDDDDGRSRRGDDYSRSRRGKIYFDCTAGAAQNFGQVWEYDPRRETITLIFESTNPGEPENPEASLVPGSLEAPDNVVIVPRTGDIFLQEDGGGTQFIRGLTPEGEIYDFVQTVTNDTEFCGGCFDADGFTLFVNQQGERSGNNPSGNFPTTPGELEGTPDTRAVTYAIYGPFEDRQGSGDEEDDDGEDSDD
jgi:secreted PhoX family phosphatase